MYVGGQSTSWIVRTVSSWELKREARRELEKTTPKIDAESIYASAEVAFRALNSVMRRKIKLAGVGRPSVLEAALFAYLFLLLELPQAKWANSRLVDVVKGCKTLVAWQQDVRYLFGDMKRPGIYDTL
jgi:metaxin